MKNLICLVLTGLVAAMIVVASRPLAAAPALKPWSTNPHPTDVARSHVEEIPTGPHQYTIIQGGTMDGRNCRTPMGCGINREGAYVQTWESNRSARMENVGDHDIVNPWLSNGRKTFRTVQEIVTSAITPSMTDAEKAYALWFQEIQYRHHSGGDNNELGDPVKIFNIYGYNTCGNDSIALATLWRAAGLKVAPARALGHCISQVFHGGAWHFYDGDMHSVYLLRDNETVAGEQDIVRDHDLIKRTHSKGILFPDTWWDGQGMCAMYFYEGTVTGERGGKADTTMNMVLRPGEALVWRWGQCEPVKYHGALHTMPTYESTICNGLWEYRPDLTKETWRKGATTVENIASFRNANPLTPSFSPSGGEGARRAVEGDFKGLAPEEGKKGTIIWTLRTPYVFVGGRIESEGQDARFSVSADGRTWQAVTNNFDKFFSAVGPARYEYKLKCELAGQARLHRLAIFNDLQMAPMALPEMAVGKNAFTYSDQSTGQRKVRITHAWIERSATRPPAAPPAPVYPSNGGEADGTDVVFQWATAEDPDGDVISDYQFELSNRADMRWPLSMCFYKLISRTADGAKEKSKAGGNTKVNIKAQYTLSQPGLLAPDRTYYWRVRAMDDKGLWGPRSQTWSFTARGPAYPVKVTLDYDPAKSTGVLRWTPSSVGRRPAKYRVYGSDEKGFTIADRPFQSALGTTKQEMAAWNPWFPANFIAETTATELVVMGSEVALASANKTYYRVVAVDERGKRSGPSDYATGPRPVIYSKPVVAAKVGAAYRYTVAANRSLGDLSARMKDGQQVSGYFDIEKPKFTVERGPAWLKIDAGNGILSGTPDTTGKTEVVVTACIERQVRHLDEPTLKWGNEKVLSVTTEQVGTATQKFVIDVQ
ncbi:MAG: putative Ig domain-containing protein [Verrucomicrobia bacterium]|nr:putative Ig domain-containing protein [Verrucomicrobiota bacterium]